VSFSFYRYVDCKEIKKDSIVSEIIFEEKDGNAKESVKVYIKNEYYTRSGALPFYAECKIGEMERMVIWGGMLNIAILSEVKPLHCLTLPISSISTSPLLHRLQDL
jgi:hypothetical protein